MREEVRFVEKGSASDSLADQGDFAVATLAAGFAENAIGFRYCFAEVLALEAAMGHGPVIRLLERLLGNLSAESAQGHQHSKLVDSGVEVLLALHDGSVNVNKQSSNFAIRSTHVALGRVAILSHLGFLFSGC